MSVIGWEFAGAISPRARRAKLMGVFDFAQSYQHGKQ